MTDFQKKLKSLLSDEDLKIREKAVEQMSQHYEIMLKWNKTHNLTRIVSLEDASHKHYLDCILGFNFVSEKGCLHDMGSGAGFPGIIGAILRPQQKFFLVEPARKRATFLKQVKSVLGLNNVHILNQRAETVMNAEGVISRGTFSWPTLSPLLDPLIPGGNVYLWIGQSPSEAVFRTAIQDLGHGCSWGSYDLGSAGIRNLGMVHKQKNS